jgi:hypothetical protein
MLIKPDKPAWMKLLEDQRGEVLAESVRRAMVLRSPRDAEELWWLIGYRLGFWVNRRPLCPEHDAPFDFLSAAFFQTHDRLLAMASAGSGKTRSFAILHELNSSYKPGTWTAHVGAVEIQGVRCFDYLQEQLKAEKLVGKEVEPMVYQVAIDGSPMRSKILWKNGSRVEVLAGTLNQVCLPGSATIRTDRGSLPIWKIVANKLPVRVWSYDFALGRWEWQPVVGWHDNGTCDELTAIRLVAGQGAHQDALVTPNHRLLLAGGSEIEASQLRVGDRVVVPGYVLSEDQEQVLLGLLLGNGSIDRHGRLAVVHGRRQQEYLQWLTRVFAVWAPSVTEHRSGFTSFGARRMRTKAQLQLREARARWYASGKKRLPYGVLSQLQPLGLAVWLMDDGSYRANQWSLATHWLTAAERAEVLAWCDGQGLDARFCSTRHAEQYVLSFSRDASEIIDRLVAAYFDFGPRRAGRWPKTWACPPLEEGQHGALPAEIGRVWSVVPRGFWQKRRFDLTVEKNHNFALASGILAANSGPHMAVGAIDEFELLNWEVWTHFALKLHESELARAQMLLGSTRFKAAGPVQKLLDDKRAAFKVFTWCVYDAMAKCMQDCNDVPGFGKCPLWSRKEARADGSTVEVPMCGGRAHHATGHLTFNEVLNAFLLSDHGSWGTLMELRSPGKRGLFYPELDEQPGGRHVRSEYEYVPGRAVYLAYDDGYNFPMALGAWQVRADGLIYQFDELYQTKWLPRMTFEEIQKRAWFRDVAAMGGFPDPTALAAIAEFNELFRGTHGHQVFRHDVDNDRVNGWRAVRRRLWGPQGEATVGWHPRCVATLGDLQNLIRKEGTEDCEKRDDHGADMVRYLLYNLERLLGYKNAIGRRPEGTVDRQQAERSAETEGLVRERWDRLRALGVKESELVLLEGRFGVQRVELAKALGGLIRDRTIAGRLERAGLAEPEPEPELDEEG